MTPDEERSPEAEHQHHRYVGNRIPWYVHLIWLTFWALAVGYILAYQFPALRREFLSPP